MSLVLDTNTNVVTNFIISVSFNVSWMLGIWFTRIERFNKGRNMNMYYKLKRLVENYVEDMEKVNNKRLEAAAKDLKYLQLEVQLFNILRDNLTKMEDHIVLATD